MNANLTGNERGLVGWWRFDDPENPGRDSSIGGHDGRLMGGAALTRLEAPVSAVSGVTGSRALRFDGKNDWLELPAIDWHAFPQFTIEAWVRDWNGQIQGQGKVGDPENSIWLALGVSNDKSQYLTSGWESNARNIQFKSGPSPTNRWVHVVMEFDGKNQSFYLDGLLKHQVASPRPGPFDMRRTLVFGKTGKGLLRSIRVSSIARYRSNFRPAERWTPDTRTVVLLQADDREGDVLKDSSGHGHDARIRGGPVYAPASR